MPSRGVDSVPSVLKFTSRGVVVRPEALGLGFRMLLDKRVTAVNQKLQASKGMIRSLTVH